MNKLFILIAEHSKDDDAGYTRVLEMEFHYGSHDPMAVIEFVAPIWWPRVRAW